MAKPATNKKARKISPPASGKSSAAAARKAAHEARQVAEAGATVSQRGQASDVFGGELRRRIFSLWCFT